MNTFNIFLNLVTQIYFKDSRCIYLFSNNSKFSFDIDVPVVSISIDRNNFVDPTYLFHYFGCQGFLIDVKNASAIITQIERAIRYDTLERFSQRRYLLINADLTIANIPELNYISDLLVVNYIQIPQQQCKEINCKIDKNNNNNEWMAKLFTHIHNNKDNTSTNMFIELITINSMDDFTIIDHDFYTNKLLDGNGRPFRIATFTYKPYSIPGEHEGTELRIALEFCRMYNLTPVYVVDEEGEWGEIFDDWTGYGILGNVMLDQGDIGLAALYTWAHEYGFLDLSKPVVRTGITCLTPAPHLADGWLLPLFSFSSELWIAVGVTFAICCATLTLLDHYTYKYQKIAGVSRSKLAADSIMDVASIFLLQSFNRFGFATKAKNFLHGCMFLYSILIACSYSSGLASSMTVPRYVGAITTVQELVDSGIQWGATSNAWIMSIMDAEEYNYQELVRRFVITDKSKLEKLNGQGFAFSIERLPAGQYAIGDYVTEDGAAALRLMQEDLYWEQCVLMMRKSSVWTPLIDDLILRLAQTGIPQIWEYRVATEHLNPIIQRTVQYSAHHSDSSSGVPVRLQWGHVQGAFGILICGNLLAVMCFIIEQLVIKFNRYEDKVVLL